MFKQIPKIDEMVSLEIVNYRGHQRKKKRGNCRWEEIKVCVCSIFCAY